MALSVMVYWKKVKKNRDSAGFTDILPLEWFAKDGNFFRLMHFVEGPYRGQIWRGRAKADLTVQGGSATLNYGRHPKHNSDDFYLGEMKLVFSSNKRQKIVQVLWRDQGSSDYVKIAARVSIGEPPPLDAAKPPERVKTILNRPLRDTIKSLEVKRRCDSKCQICGRGIELSDGTRYVEAHHIQPLGGGHKGPDAWSNIICVCPNHHVELDYGLRMLRLSDLRPTPAHSIDQRYVDYHNEHIYGR